MRLSWIRLSINVDHVNAVLVDRGYEWSGDDRPSGCEGDERASARNGDACPWATNGERGPFIRERKDVRFSCEGAPVGFLYNVVRRSFGL